MTTSSDGAGKGLADQILRSTGRYWDNNWHRPRRPKRREWPRANSSRPISPLCFVSEAQ